MSEECREATCHHCGRWAKHRLVYERRRWTENNSNDFDSRSYYVAVCDRCAEISLFVNDPPHDDITDSFESEDGDCKTVAVWPDNVCAHDVVPETVRGYYEEAMRTRPASNNSVATNIRRALESICTEQEIPPGTLSKRLQQLAFKSEMPPRLKGMIDVVRFVGNIGSHADRDVADNEVRLVEKFFKLIVEYIYIVPFELTELRTQVSQLPTAAVAESPDEGPPDPSGRIQ